MQRRIVAFLFAAAVMIVLGSAAHSAFVQAAWSTAAGLADGGYPVAISLTDRLRWAAHDLGGIFLLYGGTTSVALLVAFLIAGWTARFTGRREIVFAIAGALAIFTMFTALRLSLGTVGIFGARGPFGLAAQMGVGLIAGALFARLTPSVEARRQGTRA